MLRIISSKLAQNTPGNLSLTGNPLEPYEKMWGQGKKIIKERQQEKQRRRHERNPGQCRVCGENLSIDQYGKRFCPSPECPAAAHNRRRPRMAPRPRMVPPK